MNAPFPHRVSEPDGLRAASMAYLMLLKLDLGSAIRHCGQTTLCELRDFIASATGRDSEDVQLEFEDRASRMYFDLIGRQFKELAPVGERDGIININSLDPYDVRGVEAFDHLELEKTDDGQIVEVYNEHKQSGL